MRGRADGVRRVLAVLGTLLAVALAGVLAAAPAAAHDELLNSTPRAGASVDRLPAEVALAFDDVVLPDLSVVAVTDPGGRSMSVGAPTVTGTVVTQRTAGVAPAGTYRLAYRVVSADGHPIAGGWTFRVTGAGTVGTPAAAAAGEQGAGSSGGLGLAAVAALVLGAVGSLVLRARVIRRDAAGSPLADLPAVR